MGLLEQVLGSVRKGRGGTDERVFLRHAPEDQPRLDQFGRFREIRDLEELVVVARRDPRCFQPFPLRGAS